MRPFLADEILNEGKLNHYDKDKIAQICELKGLKSRALQLHSREDDIMRLL